MINIPIFQYESTFRTKKYCLKTEQDFRELGLDNLILINQEVAQPKKKLISLAK